MEKRDDMYKVYMHMLLISLLRRLEEVLKGIVVILGYLLEIWR